MIACSSINHYLECFVLTPAIQKRGCSDFSQIFTLKTMKLGKTNFKIHFF